MEADAGARRADVARGQAEGAPSNACGDGAKADVLKRIDEELRDLQERVRMDDGLEQRYSQQPMGYGGAFVLDPYFGRRLPNGRAHNGLPRPPHDYGHPQLPPSPQVHVHRTWAPTAGFITSDCRVAWRATNSDSRCTITIACAWTASLGSIRSSVLLISLNLIKGHNCTRASDSEA